MVIKTNLYAGQFFEQDGNSLGADARALTHEKGLVKNLRIHLYWATHQVHDTHTKGRGGGGMTAEMIKNKYY